MKIQKNTILKIVAALLIASSLPACSPVGSDSSSLVAQAYETSSIIDSGSYDDGFSSIAAF
ncbi:MAG: hypothetical protein R3D71_04400 [Rickettsiales bacterium]